MLSPGTVLRGPLINSLRYVKVKGLLPRSVESPTQEFAGGKTELKPRRLPVCIGGLPSLSIPCLF